MTDDGGTPRRTRLYGAIDPPTLDDTEPRASAPDAAVGDRISRYQIEELLGRGGMGEVLSAHDDEIGRRVAIKRLRIADPSAALVARFLREARIQGRLEHPAVVPVHELWHGADGQPFFVMKQLSGTTLADVLPRLAANDPEIVERFAQQRLLNAFADVCLAIEFAHTRGVVHRDLKPANIVLGDFGEVYVLDWGVARVAGADDADRPSFSDIASFDGTETVAGAILGTPGYISPEQIRGDLDIDARTDVYALGCILFELLALSPLHPRGQAALGSALAGIDARPSVRAPERDIPPELDDLCVRATLIDREYRLATARQLGEAVQRYLDGNRDVALRRRLATDELAIARTALGTGDGPEQRRDAMRAAARALALDPTSREPADLVGALMLQVPAETPPEVEHELKVLDIHALHTSTRFGMLAAIFYLAFFPLLYWIGFRELWYLVAGPAISVAIILTALLIAPRNIFVSGYITIAGNVAMFALFATMVSPAILGPGPPIIMITLLAAHRRLIHPWLLGALTVLGVMSPWIWQLVNGELPVSVVGTDIVIHTAATQLDPLATVVGLGIYIVSLAVLATMLSLSQHDEQREVRRVLQLQSWQLRALVPRE
jgi:tRNA A-37 threonylcarbamoyl transferase component Bud32